jgi:hypothetical protein
VLPTEEQQDASPLTGLWLSRRSLLDPVDHGVVAHTFDAFNRPKSQAIQIQTQAVALDFIYASPPA